MKRHARAIWEGSGKEGKGTLSTQTGTLQNTQYSYLSRFENGNGTNPEELIAAAHSGCFAMQLSFNLSKIGFAPDKLEVECVITLEQGIISESNLTLSAVVSGISKEAFDEQVAHAKENCPVSKLLNTKIVLESTLQTKV